MVNLRRSGLQKLGFPSVLSFCERFGFIEAGLRTRGYSAITRLFCFTSISILHFCSSSWQWGYYAVYSAFVYITPLLEVAFISTLWLMIYSLHFLNGIRASLMGYVICMHQRTTFLECLKCQSKWNGKLKLHSGHNVQLWLHFTMLSW